MSKSKSETGHAKNVANFNTLKITCVGYGTYYNPVRPSLTLDSLNTLYTVSDKSLLTAKTTKTYFDNETNARSTGFTGIKKFSTRLMRFLSSCEVDAKALEDAMGHQRKMQGRRAIPVKKRDENAPEISEKEEDKRISAIQLSYDSLLDNFKELVLTALTQPGYQANEPEFTREGLQQKIDELTLLNENVIKAHTAWYNARVDRDKILYNDLTGLKKTAFNVKNYVAGVFGMTSKEYKQISGLEFIDLRR
jgi:hypothetical protein